VARKGWWGMEIKKMVSKDVWAVINDNYEKGSYTIAITNLLQYANEIVREKSGLSLDNTKLMEAAFLGQNPKLKVNKFQTVTEKDIQSGVGYLLKGLCLAVRNPRAHERYDDNKETADRIILFIDYLLEFVRSSKQPSLVEDWIEFVFDENYNNTEEYAKMVLQEIPEKKRYEILVSIFRNRKRAKQNQLNNLVNELMNDIKPEELQEFLDNLNKELLHCCDDTNLKMFLSLFPPQKWGTLIPLAKLKIENMIQKSLEQAMMVYEGGGYDSDPDYTCNHQGSLSTWAVRFIKYFDTKDKVYRILGNKLSSSNSDVRNFVFEYFSDIVFDYELIKSDFLKNGLKRSLTYFDNKTYDLIDLFCNCLEDKDIIEIYKKELEIAKKHFEEMELKELDISDLPF